MQVYYFRKVTIFIEALDVVTRARVEKTIELLEDYGHTIGMPHSKSMGGGLFELRTTGELRVRIIFTFHRGTAMLLHGIVKKSDKIQTKELAYAIQCLKQLQ